MKIFSEIQQSPHGDLLFVLYLDTQKTGKPQEDTLYAAADARNFIHENDSGKILDFIIPLLSELVHSVYGKSLNIMVKPNH